MAKEKIIEEIKEQYMKDKSNQYDEKDLAFFWEIDSKYVKLAIKKTLLTQQKRNEKTNVFVAHIDNHLVEMTLKGELPVDSKVCCKICNKDIDTIYREELQHLKKS